MAKTSFKPFKIVFWGFKMILRRNKKKIKWKKTLSVLIKSKTILTKRKMKT